jgi:hypothetical protein
MDAFYSYRDLRENDRNAIEQSIAKCGVWGMTVETCRRAKLVCCSWDRAFSACDPCQMLAKYELLFRPMFERFVSAVACIDTTMSPKFYEGGGIIAQEEYERNRFVKALKEAKTGYGIFYEIKDEEVDRLVDDKLDKKNLVYSCGTLLEHFYEKDVVKICDDSTGNEAITTNVKFKEMTIGQMCEKLKRIDADYSKAYENVVNVIKYYDLLPIESREFVQISKVWSFSSIDFLVKLMGLLIGLIGIVLLATYIMWILSLIVKDVLDMFLKPH